MSTRTGYARSRELPRSAANHSLPLKSWPCGLPSPPDTPTAVLVRQVLGAISEFEKTSLVAELKAARDRKREATGQCGGRKSYKERSPEMVALARKLARYPVNGHKRSLRDVAAELEAQGSHQSTAGLRPPLWRA